MSITSPVERSMQGVVWTRTLQEPVRSYPAVQGEEVADVVVIGAGFCGLNIAIHAAKGGARVILVEAGTVGCGGSGRSSGFNVPQFPGAVSPSDVATVLGRRKGRLLAEMVAGGAEAVFRQIDQLQIACSAEQTGWAQPAHSAASLERVRRVYAEWKSLGVNVQWHCGDELTEMLGTHGYLGGWSNPTGGTVNPYGLTIGLARAGEALGVRLFENSTVEGIEQLPGGVIVRCGSHRIKADTVIVTTNAYTGDFLPQVQRSVVPVYLYSVATKPLREALCREILKTRMCFTDLRKSGGFSRLDRDNRLIGGGAVFAIPGKRCYGEQHVRSRMSLLFPQLTRGDIQFDDYWEGYCAVTETLLPHIVRVGNNVFAALGFSTRGVNLAQNLGRALGEFVAGKCPLSELPLMIVEQREDVGFWPVKARAARYAFPYFQAKDWLGLT